MNHIDYCISLLGKGISKDEIRQKLLEKDLDEAQIETALRRADNIFLERAIRKTPQDSSTKSIRGIKTIILVVSLVLLAGVFLGYARIGLIGLFIFWSILGYSSYRK